MIITVTLALLLAAETPAASAPSEDDTYSWCVAEGTVEHGRVRYFSDVFEGEEDVDVRRTFQEYVDQAYPRVRPDGGYATTCSTQRGKAAADAALARASAPRAGTADVMTAWRTHFE